MSNFYGCIYGLRSPSDKWYIGQTTHEPFKYIKDVYKSRKGAGRPYINHAILKYGFDLFDVVIFAYLFDQDSLDRAEVGFIEMFRNTDRSYNLSLGGSNHKMSDIQKKRISIALTGSKRTVGQRLNISKALERFTYEITDVNGSIYTTTNLYKFAKENNLSQSHLCRRLNSKGWRVISKKPLTLISQ